MQTYKLLRNVYLDGEEKLAGTVIEIKDQELAGRLLSRGSIEDASGGEVTPPAPTVLDEFVLDGLQYQNLQAHDGAVFSTVNGQPSTSEDWFAAKDEVARRQAAAANAEEVADAAPLAPSGPPAPTLDTPSGPVINQPLTPEQLQQDFEQSGASTPPQNGA